MTLWRFAERKNLWDCEIYEFSKSEHATLDYELYELYEFPKRGHPLVFTTTNYTNYTNFQNGGCRSLYELYEFSYADTTGTNSYNSFNS